MLIVYDSMTGNVERFVQRLADFKSVKIVKGLSVNEPFVLVTYTTGIGKVPKSVMEFLANNQKYLMGVAASGNKNWGQVFAASADTIAAMYEVPVLLKFELSGNDKDILDFNTKVGAM